MGLGKPIGKIANTCTCSLLVIILNPSSPWQSILTVYSNLKPWAPYIHVYIRIMSAISPPENTMTPSRLSTVVNWTTKICKQTPRAFWRCREVNFCGLSIYQLIRHVHLRLHTWMTKISYEPSRAPWELRFTSLNYIWLRPRISIGIASTQVETGVGLLHSHNLPSRDLLQHTASLSLLIN